MSRVISFRTDDEIADEIDREIDRLDGEPNRSRLTKQLVEEAVEARRSPLWLRLGLSNRHAAQLEQLRKAGESEEDVAAKLLRESIKRRETDILDELGASDELRDSVEREREAGESLDGVVERLLRQGIEADTGPPSIRSRLTFAIGLVAIGALYALAFQAVGIPALIIMSLAIGLYLVSYPTIDSVTNRLLSTVTQRP